MSEGMLTLARQSLLEPAGLGESDLTRLMGQLMSGRVDYGDLYFQYSRHESWSLEEGKVKSGSHSIEQGVGVRAVAGEKTGFAYSDEILLPALLEAAGAARAIVQQGAQARVPAAFRDAQGRASAAGGRMPGATGEAGRQLYRPDDPLASLPDDAKVKLLERVEKEARAQDPRVKQVMASLASEHEVVLVVRSDGVIAGDVRPLVRLNVTVIVEQNGRRESGSHGGGGRLAYDYFNQEDRALSYAREAVRQALVNLEAVETPAGTMTVVLGPGWPGILLHEAIGHGLEGDFNRKGTSAFAGRVGERVVRCRWSITAT